MDKYDLKDQFLSHMINELQTPLKAVLKFSDILLKDKYDMDTLEKYLKLINQSAKNIDNIVKDVSDISSIQNGTLSIDIKKTNLRDLLKQNFELFRSKAREKSIRYSLQFGKDLPKNIYTDANRLSQVISNLLSNAIRFSNKDGSVQLETLFDKKNSIIKVFVDDKGIGIPEHKKEYIFKPYPKEDSTANLNEYRTGLGLSICLSIIELLNGKIEFKSKENEGTTFSFEIPVKIED